MEEDFYALKLRLVKIDMSADAEFADELAAKLKRPTDAPTEWLLTAAAAEIKLGNYAAAGAHLARAKERLSPAAAAFLLNDQTFADQGWRKELAPVFTAPTAPPSLTTGR